MMYDLVGFAMTKIQKRKQVLLAKFEYIRQSEFGAVV